MNLSRFLAGNKAGDLTDFPARRRYTANRDKGGHPMNPFIIPVGFLNTLVSFFLLLAVDRITERSTTLLRLLLASVWGGIYGGICMVTGLRFLGSTLWRLLSMTITALIAWYGCSGALHAGMLYGILQLAMTGLAAGLNSWPGAVFLALAVCILWIFGWRKNEKVIPVELVISDKRLCFTALRDTGNTLTDPITGRPVLVVGADIAENLTGLSQKQLRSPVECLRNHPESGLCLLPYHTVSHPGGLLLAKKVTHVKIGGWKGSMLVAFAPEILDPGGKFQALAGGIG